MKLYELFGRGRTVFSCEVFPPKKTSPVDSIYRTLDGLKDIKPDFISVTFGAGGSQVNQTTWEIASIIQNQYHIPAMAHLTCVGAGRAEADETLAHLKAGGVENILALRGDVNPDVPPKTDFAHASDLVSYLRSHSDFGVSAACYPEGHLESPDPGQRHPLPQAEGGRRGAAPGQPAVFRQRGFLPLPGALPHCRNQCAH